MKTYVLAVSRYFPTTHSRKGEPTWFVAKILAGQNIDSNMWSKIHTIRKNYPLWAKRMSEVQAGRAVIELFYWKLKGGRFTKGNEKIVFATLDKDSGCGVQELTFENKYIYIPKVDNKHIEGYGIAKNDGLNWTDFKDWFKKYDLSEPLAIICFIKFRY